MGRPTCSKLCANLTPEALLACAPLGCLWQSQPRVFASFRTNHWAKGAQSCADCVRLTVLQAFGWFLGRATICKRSSAMQPPMAPSSETHATQQRTSDCPVRPAVLTTDPQGILGSNASSIRDVFGKFFGFWCRSA
jgi:hypothetical protein